MKVPTWDEIDGMVEGDPLALRDLAAKLVCEIDRLRVVFAEVAEYAEKVAGHPCGNVDRDYALTAIANTARQEVTRHG
jgi:hypothetical protein